MSIFRQNEDLFYNVFKSYFKNVIFPYVAEIQSKPKCENRPAIILYDGLKGHISNHIFGQSAELNIKIIVLPSYSSHILKPRDQRFFRSLKSIYAHVQKFPNLSKISTNLHKIFTALAQCDNHHLIIQSWTHAGIQPIIENGVVTHVEINATEILDGEIVANLQEEETHERLSRRRPDKVP